jgi:DNA-binding response OmpR family regulator
VVDVGTHQLTCGGRLIECTPGEFTLITTMAERPGQVFTRPQLLERIHGDGRFITERTVDVHIMNLRKKIEPEPARPVRLLTVFGVGYRLTDGSDAGP